MDVLCVLPHVAGIKKDTRAMVGVTPYGVHSPRWLLKDWATHHIAPLYSRVLKKIPVL